MTANLERDETGMGEMIVLRAEDGAWYELPIAALEWTRVTDPAQLEDLRNQIAAGGGAAPAGDAMPVALLSPETLATYRVDPERAAALERDAVAVAGKDDVAGYGLTDIGGGYFIQSHLNEWRVVNTTDKTIGVGLSPSPSSRFPGGFPGVAS